MTTPPLVNGHLSGYVIGLQFTGYADECIPSYIHGGVPKLPPVSVSKSEILPQVSTSTSVLHSVSESPNVPLADDESDDDFFSNYDGEEITGSRVQQKCICNDDCICNTICDCDENDCNCRKTHPSNCDVNCQFSVCMSMKK